MILPDSNAVLPSSICIRSASSQVKITSSPRALVILVMRLSTSYSNAVVLPLASVTDSMLPRAS